MRKVSEDRKICCGLRAAVKIAIIPKATYTFNSISIKIPKCSTSLAIREMKTKFMGGSYGKGGEAEEGNEGRELELRDIRGVAWKSNAVETC